MVEGMETTERYPNLDTVRWIVDVSRSGDCVVLDDGSKWHVVPSHRMISGNWPRTLKVRVTPVQGRLHTLSAENEREVQAAYQGFRPVHEESKVEGGTAQQTAPDSTASTGEDLPAAPQLSLKSET